MNIWLVNHYALPPSRPGGTRHYAFAKELQRRGHRVVILASSFDHHLRQETRLFRGEYFKFQEEEGVPFFWLRTLPYRANTLARFFNMLSFAFDIAWWAKPSVLGKPDLILGSSPHPFAALAAYLQSMRYKVPFILEVRDLWPQTLIDLGNVSPSHPLVLLLAGIERFLYKRADKIITLLPLAYLHMVQRGADRSKIVWIPNGTDLSSVPKPRPPEAKTRLTVVYAGSHGLANNLDVVLDAASILKSRGLSELAEFKFVGEGPEKARLVNKAKSLKLGNVFFEDPVPKKLIYKVLSDADVLLLTLKDGPLFRFGISSNKLFDYMAVGRPVLFAVRAPHNPVEEAGAGIVVPPDDPKALADAVYNLANLSWEERWAMGLRGRRYLEEHHSIERLVDRLEDVLFDSLKARGVVL